MSATEGSELAGTGPIDLQLPRRAAGSGNPQTSTTPATRLIDTKSFVASDSISWRQGKFPELDMVLPDCSASNQQTTLRRFQEN